MDDSKQCVVMWFRLDLRLADNPALEAAAATGLPVVPVFILPEKDHDGVPGAASAWWLHQSLTKLDESLRAKGSRLIVRRGETVETLLELAAETKAKRVFWNRVYEPPALKRDPGITAKLKAKGIETECFNGSLLFEPGSLQTTSGGTFQVFTPFWKSLWNERGHLRETLKTPSHFPAPAKWPKSLKIAELELLPKIDWANGIREAWTPGEEAARERLRWFGKGAVSQYNEERDRTDLDATSRLSPRLHFGELSPVEVWHALAHTQGAESYLRQLTWREFSYHLLCAFPETPWAPFNPQFRHFPWRKNAKRLKAWQKGRTGYPMVDAAMRQLWTSGWMHNRARLVVASFLVKHLLIPWQDGAAWFLDTLVDADLANNTMGWQWTSGCGVDAAPYFRVFNPIVQGEKFDPDGEYVRRWIPELRELPTEWIHKPWEAPPLVLGAAGVKLGETYPEPIVDHAEGRAGALKAFEEMRKGRGQG
jgi:deoxyribodipyrimidine photo-lyase